MGNDLRQTVWTEWRRAVTDRDHGWRNAVVATVDSSGLPQARTVVLRSVNVDAGQLTFYTDSRSPKVDEMLFCQRIVMVFWCRLLGWQVRAWGTAEVKQAGSDVDQAWQRIVNTPAAADYLATSRPGTPMDLARPEANSREHYLAVVEVSVDRFDWLELGPRGHRRATVTGDKIEWVVP
jgi:pyridoxamine 5'-phosphate oxidase